MKLTERKNDWHLKCVLQTLNRLEKCTNQQPNMQILTHNTWILILTWFVFQLNLHYPVTIHFLGSVLRILPKEYLMFLSWHAFVMFAYFTYISHFKLNDWNPFDIGTATKRPFTNVYEHKYHQQSHEKELAKIWVNDYYEKGRAGGRKIKKPLNQQNQHSNQFRTISFSHNIRSNMQNCLTRLYMVSLFLYCLHFCRHTISSVPKCRLGIVFNVGFIFSDNIFLSSVLVFIFCYAMTV